MSAWKRAATHRQRGSRGDDDKESEVEAVGVAAADTAGRAAKVAATGSEVPGGWLRGGVRY